MLKGVTPSNTLQTRDIDTRKFLKKKQYQERTQEEHLQEMYDPTCTSRLVRADEIDFIQAVALFHQQFVTKTAS